MNTQVWIGIILPFLGTCLGAATVFVLKDRISNSVQRNITVKFRCGCISCCKKYCPSFLPRIPDGRDITGRPWQGCHNSAASFYSCAAGFPLKSVGGREKVSLAPALSSRPDCQAGSKAPLIALAACLFTSFKLPSSRRALCRYRPQT